MKVRHSTANEKKGSIGFTDDTGAVKIPSKVAGENDAQIFVMINGGNN